MCQLRLIILNSEQWKNFEQDQRIGRQGFLLYELSGMLVFIQNIGLQI